MSLTTKNYKLHKYDPTADGEQYFNIDLALNGNLDKLDDELGKASTNATKATEELADARKGTDATYTSTGEFLRHIDSKVNMVKTFVEDGYYNTIVKEEKDENGIFRSIKVKRQDGVIIYTSFLSGGVSPQYTSRKIVEYQEDGKTQAREFEYVLTYDADGDLVAEVLK